MLQPSGFHLPPPTSQATLQQTPLIPPFSSFLLKISFKMHLQTSTMLPHVPLIQFHSYSILAPPQTVKLWLFPIPMWALQFLPMLKIRPFFSWISPWLLWSCTFNIFSCTKNKKLEKNNQKKIAQIFVIVTHNCQTLIILAHNFWAFKHKGEVIISLPPLNGQIKHVNQVFK